MRGTPSDWPGPASSAKCVPCRPLVCRLKIVSESLQNIVIAYEPIWAIGTGKTATTQQAQEMHAFIRSKLASQYDTQLSEGITILYGGSVKASNAAELFACPDVDGGLVGGASLVADDFIQIMKALK